MDRTDTLERIEKRSLLLVEGRSDDRFFTRLLLANGIREVQVHGLGSKDRLRDTLSILPRIPGYAGLLWLGIVQDADASASQALEAINTQIGRAGHQPRPLRFPECRHSW